MDQTDLVSGGGQVLVLRVTQKERNGGRHERQGKENDRQFWAREGKLIVACEAQGKREELPSRAALADGRDGKSIMHLGDQGKTIAETSEERQSEGMSA